MDKSLLKQAINEQLYKSLKVAGVDKNVYEAYDPETHLIAEGFKDKLEIAKTKTGKGLSFLGGWYGAIAGFEISSALVSSLGLSTVVLPTSFGTTLPAVLTVAGTGVVGISVGALAIAASAIAGAFLFSGKATEGRLKKQAEALIKEIIEVTVKRDAALANYSKAIEDGKNVSFDNSHTEKMIQLSKKLKAAIAGFGDYTYKIEERAKLDKFIKDGIAGKLTAMSVK
jgi:hypothetical protein